jgi:hypothetical protein
LISVLLGNIRFVCAEFQLTVRNTPHFKTPILLTKGPNLTGTNCAATRLRVLVKGSVL